MYNLILVRHGQSQWNLENRFTGWYDSELTKQGIEEAQQAGSLIKNLNINFNFAFTSFQQRAILTLDEINKKLDLSIKNIFKAWELNERHYGALQGLNKEETAKKHGEQQVKIWRSCSKYILPRYGFTNLREAKTIRSYWLINIFFALF